MMGFVVGAVLLLLLLKIILSGNILRKKDNHNEAHGTSSSFEVDVTVNEDCYIEINHDETHETSSPLEAVVTVKEDSFIEIIRNKTHGNPSNLWFGVTENGDNYIDIRKYIVHASSYECPSEWEAQKPFNAVAALITKKGHVIYKRFTARSCQNSTLYYITESEFITISMYGRIIGQVMTLEDYYKLQSGAIKTHESFDLSTESKYKLFGYSVNARDNFSADYRQIVLMFMIESGLTNKRELIKHLDFNIDTHFSLPNNELAVSKWREDMNFLYQYRFEDAKVNWVTISNPPNTSTVYENDYDYDLFQKHFDLLAGSIESVTDIYSEAGSRADDYNYDTVQNDTLLIKEEHKCKYEIGDVVQHKVFGTGIVNSINNEKKLIFIDFNGTVKKFSYESLENFFIGL